MVCPAMARTPSSSRTVSATRWRRSPSGVNRKPVRPAPGPGDKRPRANGRLGRRALLQLNGPLPLLQAGRVVQPVIPEEVKARAAGQLVRDPVGEDRVHAEQVSRVLAA